MGKFCTKCGSKLEDGVCINCTGNSKKEEKVDEEIKEETTFEPIEEEVKEETTTEVVEKKKEEPIKKEEKKSEGPSIEAEDIKKAGTDCLNAIKNIFTKPFEAIKDFVSESKLIAGIIMILLTVASAGLYKIAAINNAVSSKSTEGLNANELVNIFYGNTISNKPDYANQFFQEAGVQLAIIALTVVFGYIIITKVLKGNATIKQMITAVALSVCVVLLGNLVNSGLVYIDEEFVGYIRTYISTFANIFSILILYYGIKEIAGIDKNKLLLAVASITIAATACWDIIDKIID